MKKMIIAAAVLGLSATASFAQSGANPNAPQPGPTGAGVNQPGTTSTGKAVDAPTTGAATQRGSTARDGAVKKDGMTRDGARDGMKK